MKNDLKLLVTGTGRCGTTWMAKWLTNCGVPCGHEDVFSYRGYTPREDLQADSSWLAVPYLGLVQCPIIHVVRHPLEVIRSFMGTNHFGPFTKKRHLRKVWYQYMSLHFGYIDADPPIVNAMRYYVRWNQMIEEHDPYLLVRIDRMPAKPIIAALNIFGPDRELISPYGNVPSRETNKHPRDHTLQKLPRQYEVFNDLARMAERYGYDPQTL